MKKHAQAETNTIVLNIVIAIVLIVTIVALFKPEIATEKVKRVSEAVVGVVQEVIKEEAVEEVEELINESVEEEVVSEVKEEVIKEGTLLETGKVISIGGHNVRLTMAGASKSFCMIRVDDQTATFTNETERKINGVTILVLSVETLPEHRCWVSAR